jgi:putative phosphoribosyl transferase
MFYDRYEAGRDLAEELAQYEATDAVICTIPRGGILTGIAVAKRLKLSLEIMVISKGEHVAKDAPLYYAISEFGTYECSADDTLSEAEIKNALVVTTQKRLAYTDSEVLPDWSGKTVIVVDDGAESGLTIKTTVRALQEQKPKKIIVALPAASKSVMQWLEKNVDEVVVIKVEPEFSGFIQEHFSYYPEVFDKEVHVAYWHAKHLFEQNYTSKNN